MHLLLDTH